MSKKVRRVLTILGVLVVLGLLMTAGAWLLETNPPVAQEPRWDSPATRALAVRACFDCHSNATVWPWYARLPLSSWLLAFDVTLGRRELNFSEWNAGRRGGSGEAAETIQRGSMPPAQYVLMHPSAALSAQEKQQLIQGLQQSLK